jgi:hypothetical protein
MRSERDLDKEQYWRRMHEKQRGSGLSQKAYCAREGLNPNTFSSWKKIIGIRDGEQQAEVRRAVRQAVLSRAAKIAAPASFIPLVPSTSPEPEPPPPPPINNNIVAEISFSGGLVRIVAGADCKTLGALLRALKECANC